MQRVLSAIVAVALILALGALAVMALPASQGVAAPAPLSAAAPDAPASAQNYNMIAMPLDATNQFTSASLGFNSQGLAALVGPSVSQVLRWDAALHVYDTWDPVNGDGFIGGVYSTTPFPLAVGGAFWLLVDSGAPPVVSFVGDVPAAGSVKFTFVGASPSCAYNQMSVPLDQSTLTNADLLGKSISTSDAIQVLRWDATRQAYDTWDPVNGDGFFGGVYTTTPWEVKIGYPYIVCLADGANGLAWPH